MKDAYEGYNDEFNILNNKVSLLIEGRNKDELIEIIKSKQISEIEYEKDKNSKVDDLIIWNAVYAREITRNGIPKKYLFVIYEKYYKKIKESLH